MSPHIQWIIGILVGVVLAVCGAFIRSMLNSLAQNRAEMQNSITQVRTEMQNSITQVRTEMQARIKNLDEEMTEKFTTVDGRCKAHDALLEERAVKIAKLEAIANNNMENIKYIREKLDELVNHFKSNGRGCA